MDEERPQIEIALTKYSSLISRVAVGRSWFAVKDEDFRIAAARAWPTVNLRHLIEATSAAIKEVEGHLSLERPNRDVRRAPSERT